MADTTNPVNTANPLGELRYGARGAIYRIVATRAQTDNSHFAVEAYVPPGGGLRPRVHTREDIFFYVLEGEMTIWFEGSFLKRPAGCTAFVARGRPHGFENFTERPARVLLVFTPCGVERYFEFGLPLPDGSPPSDDMIIGRAIALAPIYGIQLLNPLMEPEAPGDGGH